MENEPGHSSVLEHLLDLASSSADVDQFLDCLVNYSAETLGGARKSLCAITLKQRRKTTMVACSDARTRELDEIQHSLGEGPCLQALQTCTTVLIPDLDMECRWPEYVEAISAEGIRSVLAVPLPLAGESKAALNLYAREPRVFNVKMIEEAENYAASAARILNFSVNLSQRQDIIRDLKSAMTNRTAIDLAVGIIMAENRCSQARAVNILREASNHRNVKLRELAMQIAGRISSDPTKTHFDE